MTLWECGFWRWGQFRQQCNKQHRIGETCGLKLVYDTKREREVCKLCSDMEKKQRRYDRMSRDIDLWSHEGNRFATIERSLGEMQDILGQICRMRGEHDCKIASLGSGADPSVLVTAPLASPTMGFPITAAGSSSPADEVRAPFHGHDPIDHHRNLEAAPVRRPDVLHSLQPDRMSQNALHVGTSSSSSPPSLTASHNRSHVLDHNEVASRPTLDREEEDQQPYSQLEKSNLTLDFESSPTLKEIESFIESASNGTSRVVALTCLVNWQLLDLYTTELEPEANLCDAITLTGTLSCAELNTCSQFSEKNVEIYSDDETCRPIRAKSFNHAR